VAVVHFRSTVIRPYRELCERLKGVLARYQAQRTGAPVHYSIIVMASQQKLARKVLGKCFWLPVGVNLLFLSSECRLGQLGCLRDACSVRTGGLKTFEMNVAQPARTHPVRLKTACADCSLVGFEPAQ